MIRQNLSLITALVSVALIGLVAVQLFWIRNAVTLKEEEFNRNVHDALDNLVYRLDKTSAAAKIQKKIKFHKQAIAERPFANILNAGGEKIKQDKIIVKILEELSIDSNGVVTTSIKEHQYAGDSAQSISDFPAQFKETTSDVEKLKLELVQKRAEMFNDIFDELISINVYKNYKPAVDSLLLDSLLRNELRQKGIFAEYVYALHEFPQVNLKSLAGKSDSVNSKGSFFKVNLSPNNIFVNPLYLTLHFPNEQNYLLRTLWLTLSMSAVIILVLVLSFFYTINTIHRQKKYTQIKNDFIGNMTHEFKTPISTIALAGEMLGDNSVNKTPEKIDRFVKMIRDENRRLGVLVESILQTAVLDKGDFKLKRSEFNLHDVINEAVEKAQLQIEQKKGILHESLKASNAILFADKVHITNIVYNLLDNALKYSKDIPEILISTQNFSDGILLSVEDKGIGISKENQKKIFEQFYRVSTGNVHNIRGFGLGLSYVKAIVQKHGGEISVTSELNKGSIFKIYLPFRIELNA
jgi:two-component system, OmpR family, phosphate regulon sensor histidine kinase PhoR